MRSAAGAGESECDAYPFRAAGDQGPEPRGTLAHAQEYGKQLAQAVRQVLAGEMQVVQGALGMSLHETQLEFKPVSLESFRKDMHGKNLFLRKRAQLMVAAFNAGHPIDSIPYPVQALRLGRGPTLLFLSGEIVVDYALNYRFVALAAPLPAAAIIQEACNAFTGLQEPVPAATFSDGARKAAR